MRTPGAGTAARRIVTGLALAATAVLLLPTVAGAQAPAAASTATVATLELFPPGGEPTTLRFAAASGAIGGTAPRSDAAWVDGPVVADATGVSADPDDPSATTEPFPSADDGPVTGSAGVLSAGVDGGSAHALVLGGRIRVAPLAELAPPEMLEAFHRALDAGMPAVQEAAAQLLALAEPIAEQDPSGSLAELTGIAGTFVGAMPGFAALMERSPVLVLEGVRATQEVTRADASELAGRADVFLDRMELLGVLAVESFASSVGAEVTGTPGGAAVTHRATTGRVAFGQGLFAGTVGADGVVPSLPGVPAELADALQAANDQFLGALDALHDQLGITVRVTDAAGTTGDDGTAADASGAGMEIVVHPPTSPEPLLRLRLGASQVSLRGATATATAPEPSVGVDPAATPTPAPGPPADGPLPATGGGAGALVGFVALLASRRLGGASDRCPGRSWTRPVRARPGPGSDR